MTSLFISCLWYILVWVCLISFSYWWTNCYCIFDLWVNLLQHGSILTWTTYFDVKNIHGSICSNMVQNL
jgi:hypothetical protein